MKETNDKENYAEAVVPEVSSKTPVESSGKKKSSVLCVHGLTANLFCDHGTHLKATVFKATLCLNIEMSVYLVAKSF